MMVDYSVYSAPELVRLLENKLSSFIVITA